MSGEHNTKQDLPLRAALKRRADSSAAAAPVSEFLLSEYTAPEVHAGFEQHNEAAAWSDSDNDTGTPPLTYPRQGSKQLKLGTSLLDGVGHPRRPRVGAEFQAAVPEWRGPPTCALHTLPWRRSAGAAAAPDLLQHATPEQQLNPQQAQPQGAASTAAQHTLTPPK